MHHWELLGFTAALRQLEDRQRDGGALKTLLSYTIQLGEQLSQEMKRE